MCKNYNIAPLCCYRFEHKADCIFLFFPPSTSCAFVSNLNESAITPKLQPGQEVMQSVLEKDLVMNVYRDGHWGAFRHQLVTAGNIFLIITQ